MGYEARLSTFSQSLIGQVRYPRNLQIAEEYRRRIQRGSGFYDSNDVVARKIALADKDIYGLHVKGKDIQKVIISGVSSDTLAKLKPIVSDLASGKKFKGIKDCPLEDTIF